jgi:hypothetical protein
MENGVIVSKPLESKVASVPPKDIRVNKTKVIAEFISSNGAI